MSDDYWRSFSTPLTEPGDTVKGVLERRDKGTGRDGGDVPRLTIRTDDGRRLTINVTQSRLLAELIRLAPRVGDRIGIRYVGEEKNPGGLHPTKLFTVFVRRPGEPGPPVSPALEFPALADDAGVDLDDAIELALGRRRGLPYLNGDEYALLRAHLQSIIAARQRVAEGSRP